jgi:hypothetical protein
LGLIELADFPELLIRDYQSLVAALRAVQRFIGISNACLEEISGLPSAAADKYLGPSQTKRIGPNTLGLLLGGLGIRLRVEIDLEQTQRLAHRWEKRRADHVREHTRLSKEILAKARPIILAELGLAKLHGQANGNGYKG